MTADVVPSLSAEAARALTDRIRTAAERVYALLLEAHERQAWAALGYGSWRDYATTEFGFSQSHAYRLLDQARVVREIEAAGLSPIGELPNEAQARALAGAARFPYIPRLRFRDDLGWHDLMLRDWGCYELMRKQPERRAEMAAFLHLGSESSLLVGNLNQHRTSWLVISVLNGLRAPAGLFELPDPSATP